MVRKFDDETLVLVRSLPLTQVLDRLGVHLGFFWRRDADFRPIKSARTQRLYVSWKGAAWELLVTDEKWWDVRGRKGGGGGIDLVMHLAGVDFVAAVKLLKDSGTTNNAVRHPVVPEDN